MKRKVSALLSAIILLSVVFVSCSCGKTPSHTTDGLKILKINNGVLLECAGQADENGVYRIPDNVFEIGEGAFSNDTTVKKIIVGANVKKISAAAFYANSSLNEIVFEGNGLESIGGGAFIGCTSLKSITLPDGLKELGPYAFFSCSSLQSVVIPDGIKEIYSYTFARCSSLTSVTLPDSVENIGTAAFNFCSSLSDMELPASLSFVDEAAFSGCSAVNKFDFTKTKLQSIEDSAFVSCTGLKSIYFPDTLEKIGEQAFFNCPSLYDIKMSENVSEIGAFALNFTPWYAEIADDYKIVGDGVLIKCNVSPEKIDLSGKNIKYIGSSAFWNAENDTSFAGYSEYGADNGYKYASTLKNLSLPEGLLTVGDYAFTGCKLENITLPESIEHIGDGAFDSVLNGAGSVDFSSLVNLKTIGLRAFSYCDSIKEVNLPDSIERVERYAFLKTGAMENFIENARKTNSADDNFWISGDGVLLYAVVDTGKTEVTVPNGVKMIAGGAFAGWDNGVVYDSNDGITDKYWYNAWNIDKLEKVTLPESVDTICDGAFVCASSLKSVNIPDKVSYIGDETFLLCSKLSKVELGKNIKRIGYRAFAYSGLTEFSAEELPIDSVGSEAFYNCTSLVNILLPTKLVTVGNNLLVGCTAFENICIPESFSPRIFEIIGNDIYVSSSRGIFNINYYEK